MERILVVDDEVLLRDLLYQLLTKKGYKVFTTPSGEEALKLLGEQDVDLVILDYQMPGLNGLETIKRIKAMGKPITFLMFTGISTEEIEKEARKLGVVDFLPKGVGVEMFMRSILAALELQKTIKSATGRMTKPPTKIMVVDDEAEVRFMLEKFLVRKGFEVLSAASGEEALELIKTFKPRLVLLDIRLPGMDGLLTLKKIKEIDNSVGVIMISGINELAIAREAMKHGAYEYVMKPFNLEYLEMAILTKILLAESEGR